MEVGIGVLTDSDCSFCRLCAKRWLKKENVILYQMDWSRRRREKSQISAGQVITPGQQHYTKDACRHSFLDDWVSRPHCDMEFLGIGYPPYLFFVAF